MSSLNIGIAIILLAVILFIIARLNKSRSGLPAGRVIYTDTTAWSRVEKPLYDPATQLTGKPDYLVEKQGQIIPVEVKSGRAPNSPYDSHVYQLAAYCLLVERSTGKRPEHGILHYTDRDFTIEYTPKLEQDLLGLMDGIRTAERSAQVARSHNLKGRCQACGFQSACDQSLA